MSHWLRFPLLTATLLHLATHARAQQAAPRPLIISPLLGEVIDRQEKATYGLFPYYAADSFEEARFEQAPPPDSTITLRTTLRDGRVALRPFTAAEVAALRQQIETRAREVGSAAPATAATDSVGRRYRVTLWRGSTFDGELTDRQPTRLEFRTADLGIVQVKRADIMRLQELTSALARRPASWYDIGNGNRLFFAPTARNLRRGEGALQDLNVYIIGANYGITDNVSLGLLFSALPGVPLRYQFLAFTPKVAAPLAANLSVGAGLLYIRIPDFGQNRGAFGVGLGYGVLTCGSADNNLTAGLGYGFAGNNIGSTPVLQLGGQKRVSRRISLISENYFIANGDSGVGGLYGLKVNWRRTSLGLAAAYVLPYHGDYAFSSYVIPLYYDFTFRFGKPGR